MPEVLIPGAHPDSPRAAEPCARARVTLVRPPTLQVVNSLSYYGAIPPVGIAYVAAALRHAEHDVAVIDASGEALGQSRRFETPIGPVQMVGLSPAEIVERIDPATRVLGITNMFFHEWPLVREISERARARFPHLSIVLGGENASAFWEEIFRQTEAVDYCVLGEGEATIVELVARLLRGESPQGMAGVAWRGGEALAARRLSDLDAIPWPAWDLFPLENYLSATCPFGVNRGRSIPMLASRGCPYQCTFCSSPQMWTTRYGTRDPRDVVAEIKTYVERYAIDNVDFCDLTAILEKEWIVEFCRVLEAEKVRITWQLPVGTRSEALDEEVLRLLYRTGCRNVNYAPESGSARMLRAIKKKVKIPRLLKSLHTASKIGLVTGVNIIVGHPEERRRDLWQTFWFLQRCAWLGSQDASVMVFAPYPGSEDYRKLKAAGRLDMPGDEACYLSLARAGRSPRTYNPNMGRHELILWQFGLLLSFYVSAYLRRPWRLLDLLRSLWTGREESRVEMLVTTKLRQVRSAL